MLTTSGLGIAGFATGTAFTAPACDSVTKDKAVRYTGITINYFKDLLPLAEQLGGDEIVALLNKAIPVLEKLKDALEKSDLPTAGNFFDTVTSILGQIATALLQLPESNGRNIFMGILTAVNITLRTVSLFVESETPAAAVSGPRRAALGIRKPSTAAEAIRKAFDATRF